MQSMHGTRSSKGHHCISMQTGRVKWPCVAQRGAVRLSVCCGRRSVVLSIARLHAQAADPAHTGLNTPAAVLYALGIASAIWYFTWVSGGNAALRSLVYAAVLPQTPASHGTAPT
jgi:hypothetical protein